MIDLSPCPICSGDAVTVYSQWGYRTRCAVSCGSEDPENEITGFSPGSESLSQQWWNHNVTNYLETCDL